MLNKLSPALQGQGLMKLQHHAFCAQEVALYVAKMEHAQKIVPKLNALTAWQLPITVLSALRIKL